MRNLEGKVVAVIGASSGMGRATALAFARKGSIVAVGARNEENLMETAEIMRTGGGRVFVHTLDVQQRADVAAFFARVKAELARVDVLIYAAGTNTPRRQIEILSPAAWHEIIETNLAGAFHCTQEVIPLMLNQGEGLIIYLSSGAAKRVDQSGVAYQASKRGLVGLAHGAMEELKGRGVRTTVIFPGLTDTPMLMKRPKPTPPEHVAKALQPEDIAEACLFVASMPERVHIPEMILYPSKL